MKQFLDVRRAKDPEIYQRLAMSTHYSLTDKLKKYYKIYYLGDYFAS